MIATLKSSVGKMNELLARLSPQAPQIVRRSEPMMLRPILSSAIAAKRRNHEVQLLGDASLRAIVDPLGLEQALGHLLQNAVEASPADKPVTVRVRATPQRLVTIATGLWDGRRLRAQSPVSAIRFDKTAGSALARSRRAR